MAAGLACLPLLYQWLRALLPESRHIGIMLTYFAIGELPKRVDITSIPDSARAGAGRSTTSDPGCRRAPTHDRDDCAPHGCASDGCRLARTLAHRVVR